MMRDAYTLVHGWPNRHLDVGRTFENEEQAHDATLDSVYDYEVVTVTCHVDDFTTHEAAQFMVRTDGIHEVSLVVDTYDSDNDWGMEYPNNCRVNTQLVAEEEYDGR